MELVRKRAQPLVKGLCAAIQLPEEKACVAKKSMYKQNEAAGGSVLLRAGIWDGKE